MIHITDLSVGQAFTAEYAVCTAAQIRKTSKGKDYLDATLFDGKNSINAKMWDWTGATDIARNEAYQISGTISEYNGVKQVLLTAFVTTGSPYTDKMQAIYAFLAPNRGFNVEELWNNISVYSGLITAPNIAAFVNELIFNDEVRWKTATAAIKMHHVQAGGLLQHTVEVVSFAEKIFESAYIPEVINRDLLIAGAMLHDIGKLETYTLDKTTFVMTTDGILKDHTAIGSNMLMNSASAKRYPETATLLGHIILSHHGTLEYGAAVKPAFLEAYIVSVADKMSADMDMFSKAYADSNYDNSISFYTDTFNRTCLTPRYILGILKREEGLDAVLSN